MFKVIGWFGEWGRFGGRGDYEGGGLVGDVVRCGVGRVLGNY